MSFQDGWAAINLEMPPRIPRTEYSIEGHWDLLKTVTGIDVGLDSPTGVKRQAQQMFFRLWNYDFFWSTLIGNDELGPYQSDMGHAEYAAGGIDRRDHVYTLYDDPEDVLNFDPLERLPAADRTSLIARFEAHYQANCAAHPDGVNMTGVYISLVSGLIALFGWDMLLLAAGTDAKRFGELTHRYGTWMQSYFEAMAESNVPIFMMHDDMVWASGPIFRPAWYREYVFSQYKKYLTPLRDSGKKVIFTSDGDFTMFIDDMVGVGVHGFVLEPMTSLEYLVERYGQTHVIIGNADTRILLNGSRADVRAEVERCMSLGRGCAGFFMAVGNHIPANTPIENALYYNQVYTELCRR